MYPFPFFYMREQSQVPSPLVYTDNRTVQQDVEQNHFAKTMGVSYEKYKKAYVPGTYIVNEELAKEIPGVGKYKVRIEAGKEQLKYSLYGRGRDYLDMQKIVSPPCNQYSPSTILQKDTRFGSTTFGKGWKYDFTYNPNKFPGPGTYVMPSAFDKFSAPKLAKKKKKKNVGPLY